MFTVGKLVIKASKNFQNNAQSASHTQGAANANTTTVPTALQGTQSATNGNMNTHSVANTVSVNANTTTTTATRLFSINTNTNIPTNQQLNVNASQPNPNVNSLSKSQQIQLNITAENTLYKYHLYLFEPQGNPTGNILRRVFSNFINHHDLGIIIQRETTQDLKLYPNGVVYKLYMISYSSVKPDAIAMPAGGFIDSSHSNGKSKIIPIISAESDTFAGVISLLQNFNMTLQPPKYFPSTLTAHDVVSNFSANPGTNYNKLEASLNAANTAEEQTLIFKCVLARFQYQHSYSLNHQNGVTYTHLLDALLNEDIVEADRLIPLLNTQNQAFINEALAADVITFNCPFKPTREQILAITDSNFFRRTKQAFNQENNMQLFVELRNTIKYKKPPIVLTPELDDIPGLNDID